MNETPEAVRERVKQEELAKGSDPRVAESRSKAAEARARHGLPIDPQLAWKAKLEQEGGGGRPAAQEAAPAPAEAPPADSPAAADAEAPAPAGTGDAPPAPAQPAPVAAQPAPAAAAPVVPAASPGTVGIAASVPDLPDPEVGDLIEAPEVDTVDVGGGIRARNAGIPAWLTVVMVAIVAWAVMYLVVFGTRNPIRESTGCIVSADATFTCFHPKSTEEAGEGGGGH